MTKIIFIITTLFFGLAAQAAQSTLQELTNRQNFLAELLVRVQTETLINHESNNRIVGCRDVRNKSEDCIIARVQVLQNFPEVVRQARIHLAMGYRDGIFGGSFTKVNSGMWNLGTYKDVSWSRLTAAEENIANNMMERYKREGHDEAVKNPKIGPAGSRHDRWVNLSVRKKRLVHLELYKQLLSQIVLLQYVSSDHVNTQVIGDALAKLMDRSNKEVNTVTKMARIAENWIKNPKSCAETIDYQMSHPNGDGGILSMAACIYTPPALFQLLDYRAAVEGMLIDYPQFASVVNSLQSERTGRSLLTGAFIALPTLAVCIFAPPLIAVPAGAAAGGLAFLSEQHNYNVARRRELSKIVNVAGRVDWDALKSARLSRNISVALVPFFGAGRYASPFLKNAASPVGKFIVGMNKFKYFKYAKKK